jgi:hypothetical protein
MRKSLTAILLALFALGALGLAPILGPIAASGPALAGEHGEEDPEVLMREGMERMLRAIELLIEMIPMYEPPEITEEGDIIIRRKRRPGEEEQPFKIEEEET